MDENPSEKGSHSRKRPRERKSTNICLHKTYEEWAHQKEKYEEHRKAFRLSSGMSSRDFRDTATHGDFAKHLLESHSRFCEFCRKNANLTPTETFPIPDQPPASYTVFTDACTQTETESPDDDATADSSQGKNYVMKQLKVRSFHQNRSTIRKWSRMRALSRMTRVMKMT